MLSGCSIYRIYYNDSARDMPYEIGKICKFLSAVLERTDERLNDSDGPFFFFSIRCSLSNAGDCVLFQSPKVIYWHDANTCKGKVPADQLLL